jgi:hypothetical protein
VQNRKKKTNLYCKRNWCNENKTFRKNKQTKTKRKQTGVVRELEIENFQALNRWSRKIATSHGISFNTICAKQDLKNSRHGKKFRTAGEMEFRCEWTLFIVSSPKSEKLCCW